MASLSKKVGNTIKTLRKSESLSTQELAEKLNISTGLLNNIENARNDVFKLNLLLKITDVFDITLSDLLEYDPGKLDKVNINKDGKIFIEFSVDNCDIVDSNKILSNIKLILIEYIDLLKNSDLDEECIDNINKYMLQSFSFIKRLSRAR